MNKVRYIRIYFFLPVVLLSCLYIVPVWKISLGIPQYPREVFIRIHIDRLENGSEKAIEILNVLNKSIGMKPIDPVIIPELRLFPWLLGGLIFLGLVAAAMKHPLYRVAWTGLLLIAFMAAIADFYLWLFDYGHDLSADAPIKINGSSFQPPLIGTKVIANFAVRSIPLAGAWIAGASLLLALFIAFLENRKS